MYEKIRGEQTMKESSFFYKGIENINEKVDSTIEALQKFSIERQFQIYVIDKPLMERDVDYDANDLLIILSPYHSISIVSINNNKDEDEFDEIVENLTLDIGYLAKKFKYQDVIGRPKKWMGYIKTYNLDEIRDLVLSNKIEGFFNSIKYVQPEDRRKVDLLISLITGSINDIDKVGNEVPQTLLEKIRHKIVLFDGDQTRFIYEDLKQDIIKIQGLAGTGKTELLLHRLKELYTENETNKIAFSCHNIALANKMKSRVPEFFDFMKVEEQIKWNERLWVFHGWGSQKNQNNVGLYSLICNKYNLPFYNAGEGDFTFACKKTLEYILKKESEDKDLVPFFDYILIDEAQDFPEEFIEICRRVTKKTLYLAGDIFQDIFDMQELASEPDFSLNKVYRTHPKNLMFAHAVGMGLFELPTVTWLDDNGWESCGYIPQKNGRNYKLTREAILRFQELETEGLEHTKIVVTPYLEIKDTILKTIKDIIQKHPDVVPDDIAIILTKETLNRNDYELVTKIEVDIYNELNWHSSVTYKDKRVEKGKITISNKNNIKGLEFPFVICVANNQITRKFAERNTLYMALTRSFLTSYLIISKENNDDIINLFSRGLEKIRTENAIYTIEPTLEEQALQKRRLSEIKKQKKSQLEVLHEIFDDLELDYNDQTRIQASIGMLNVPTTDYKVLEKLVKTMLEV